MAARKSCESSCSFSLSQCNCPAQCEYEKKICYETIEQIVVLNSLDSCSVCFSTDLHCIMFKHGWSENWFSRYPRQKHAKNGGAEKKKERKPYTHPTIIMSAAAPNEKNVRMDVHWMVINNFNLNHFICSTQWFSYLFEHWSDVDHCICSIVWSK